ncbi:MAG: CcmD family protein [Flavisolibacter sp.]|jgi:hypothetical protein|nr:CcmD family protein [Flavisolibacter sp.]
MDKKIGFIILLLLVQLAALAQPGGEVEMADAMHANGKIYVVVAVILTIFAGIIIYLVRLDRKISKLEKNNS